MNTKILFALALAVALFTAGQAQTLDKAKLDQFFDRLAEKNKAMGSLVLAKDGEVIYARAIGYGQIDATAKKPLDAASRFRIGSITKMFTSVMIQQLAEEGKLKLTDPLDKFLPQIPHASKITLQQILSHRSGIPNVRRERDPQSKVNVNTLPITKKEILELIVKATPDFEPDTKSSYSNSGFFVLGLIIEQVTGQSYAEALAARITAKLGLKDTYLATGGIDVSQGEALTYFAEGPGWKQGIETHPSILFGAGQIVSTPSDLAKFIHALFEGKLISQESLTRMKTIRDGEGLGLEPFTLAGKTFYGHSGGADNYGASLAYLPEERLAVAYATNAKVYPVTDIMKGVVDLYYKKPFEIPAFATLVVSPEILDQYVGVYSSPDAPAKFTITREGTTLYTRPGNQALAALEAAAENKFQLLGGRVTFEFDAAKKQMVMKRGGAADRFHEGRVELATRRDKTRVAMPAAPPIR